jgi:hypothetical protein
MPKILRPLNRQLREDARKRHLERKFLRQRQNIDETAPRDAAELSPAAWRVTMPISAG